MYRSLISLLLAASFAFAVPAAATQYLRLVNPTATPIVAVEAAPAGSDDWGRLSLAQRPLRSGDELRVKIDGSRRCRFDLRLTYADGRRADRRGMNLCRRSLAQPAILQAPPADA
jgi:hypothetical protein